MTQGATEGGGRASIRRRAGVLGAVIGAVAAGVAAGVATERALLRRTRRGAPDPHGEERFGPQAYDESLTVTTEDGVGLYVEIVEPSDGVELDLDLGPAAPEPTLVFSHGFCLDMGTFFFQRAALGGQLSQRREWPTRSVGWRMVFYDQPGHGRSGHREDGEYTLESLGRALHAVVEETTPDGPIVLIGHSMGGMAILAFAEQYPSMFDERVAGVVLIGSSAGRLEATKLGLPAIVARAGRPLLPLVNGATRLTGTVVDRARQASSDLAWLLTRRYGFGTAKPSPALVSFVERMNSRTSTETVARYLRTLYTHARYPVLESLRDIPVLVVCGERDQITPLALSEEICRRLPDAELVTVPDSGHVVLLEHSAEVNEALIDFLEKIA